MKDPAGLLEPEHPVAMDHGIHRMPIRDSLW